MKSSRVLTVLAAFLLAVSAAPADQLLDDTNLITASGAAPPAEYSFTTTTAQALTVTLQDFQSPTAFSSLQVAATLGGVLVGSASVDPSTHMAMLAMPAAIGSYVLHVIGTPVAGANSTIAIGSFGACVAPTATPTACIAADSFSGNIETPGMPSATPSSALNTTFESTIAGVYTVTIGDDAFPIALQSLAGGIASGSTPISNLSPGVNQVTLSASTIYTLVIGAVADANLQAGLYGIHIADPAGSAVLDLTVPVGTLPSPTIISNPATQSVTTTLTDFAYPAPLAGLGVAVTKGSALLAALPTPGTTSATLPAGSISVWQYAVTSSQPGVYELLLATSAASDLYADTQVVQPAGAAAQTFAFVASLASSGTYNLVLTDFKFPEALASTPAATVAQNGVVLTLSDTGSFTAQAGDVVVVVNAAAADSGSGIFDVAIQSNGSPVQTLFDHTQSVGATFSTQSITVASSGSYDVTLTDLGFPQNFGTLALLVSQGAQTFGKIYGGGSFPIGVVPGTYTLTFIDAPSSDYGLYSVNVASALPVLSLTAAQSSITAGQTVSLTWSSQNATACTATGAPAWNGPEATSGTLPVELDATSTLTLTCTGAGGTASQSVAVATTAAPAKSGGGGGFTSWQWLVLLCSTTLACRMRGATRYVRR